MIKKYFNLKILNILVVELRSKTCRKTTEISTLSCVTFLSFCVAFNAMQRGVFTLYERGFYINLFQFLTWFYVPEYLLYHSDIIQLIFTFRNIKLYNIGMRKDDTARKAWKSMKKINVYNFEKQLFWLLWLFYKSDMRISTAGKHIGIIKLVFNLENDHIFHIFEQRKDSRIRLQ